MPHAMAEVEQDGAEVVGLEDGRAEEVISVLSSDTARRVYGELRSGPATTSELADDLDLSLQNAHHHLKRLRTAGLVEVEDTRLSEKRNEMKVYGAADAPVIVLPGAEDADGLRDLLKRFLGAAALLGSGGVAIRLLRGAGAERSGGSLEAERVPGTTDAPAPTGGAQPLVETLPPEAWFLIGGALVAAALLMWNHLRE